MQVHDRIGGKSVGLSLAAFEGKLFLSLGRKNFLFAGSDGGGERAEAIYSVIGTAKLNRFDPEAYLRYVITHIDEHRINKIAELLPWYVAAKLRRTTTDTIENPALAA